MKQKINLYVKQEKVKTPLSALSCLAAVLALTLILGLWSMMALRGANQMRLETLELKQDTSELQRQTSVLREQKRPRPEQPALRQQHDRLKQQLADQRRFAELLTQQVPSGIGVFSPLLDALADKALDGVWLERIQSGHNGRTIALQGQALNAELVPRYLDSLGEAEVYRNALVDQFELDEGERGLTFSVSGTLAERKGS